MRLFVLLLSLFCLFDLYSVVHCKRFSRCGLAKELKRQGFKDLRNWVCLIEAESSRRTDLIGKPNKDKSRDYGLFQINSRYWCSEGRKPGKDCNVKCKDLLKDNISIASKCAKKIYARHAFEAWYGWKNKCKGKRLPDLSKCKL